MRVELGLWLYGMVSAFIGGGAGALSAGAAVSLVDPDKFNLAHPGPLFLAMGTVFVFSGITPFFAYLKQHPLPEIVTVTKTETTSVQANPPAIVQKTVETTETKPAQEQK